MAESTQHKLDRVRAPRVQITYDLELDGAKEKKELPYVIGVVGDFSGQPDKELPRLKDRKFVGVDRDNFNDVLKASTPRVQLKVDNTLKGDGSQLGVELRFSSMQDFEPEQVVRQVEPLRKLLEVRQKLSDLRNKMAGNERLEEELQKILESTELLQKLGQETGSQAGAEEGQK
jgi:type VI secretion system protein ImpB